MSVTIQEFTSDIEGCFPDLVFHARIYETINAYHDIGNHSDELIRHLSILNDHVKRIYTESEGNIETVFSRLSAEYGIISSGRGSNEGLDLFTCNFINSNGENVRIRCNPHTKLYEPNSDYRIYFHWGNANIENGKILIGHIGRHWV
jgi:hypothetical protein